MHVLCFRCDFGLINLLYWKADANLDHIISKSELQTIWHGFDKNGQYTALSHTLVVQTS